MTMVSGPCLSDTYASVGGLTLTESSVLVLFVDSVLCHLKRPTQNRMFTRRRIVPRINMKSESGHILSSVQLSLHLRASRTCAMSNLLQNVAVASLLGL